MTKALIRDGDPTTTRGIVLAHSSTIIDGGKKVALHGDHATCGNCEGSFPIYGTGKGISENGRDAVVEGDPVMCPCKKNRVLSSNSSMFLHPDSGTSSALGNTPASAANPFAAAQRYDQQIQLFDEASGKPLAQVRYRITGDAGTFEGRTNEMGMTQRVASDAEDTMTLEIFGEGI